ncbi:Bud9p NDAI_0D04060 [Naumovozyma dairenensis CBS 421]|uniref:Uncharacterized protein n=1 Tax=Naumovozyma dairenensis (strain ATCC 10597 / BCRC 20456 / CBS 421 / NBRC 0211 / NRRL Y-12639) TaxID=1071378 RepID=G0WAA9_NAUDC|nr:hypothetical protein NDAI_0D04060 [Naumovozyma dairenensis CBS 421]CCD24720.1 hypothetical protein NDAI_0D04060 [Naumovozyma dairenensis CBS 421]
MPYSDSNRSPPEGKRPPLNKTTSLFQEGSSNFNGQSPSQRSTTSYTVYIDREKLQNAISSHHRTPSCQSGSDCENITSSGSENDTDTDSDTASDMSLHSTNGVNIDIKYNRDSTENRGQIRHNFTPSANLSPPALPYNTSFEDNSGSIHESRGHVSIGTVSTSMLLNKSSNNKLIDSSPSFGSIHSTSTNIQKAPHSTSSYKVPLTKQISPTPVSRQDTAVMKTLILNQSLSKKSELLSENSSSIRYDDTIEPKIEHAVELLRKEINVNTQDNAHIKPELNISTEFIPQKYKIPTKALQSPIYRNSRRQLSVSILNNKILPSPTESRVNRTVSLNKMPSHMDRTNSEPLTYTYATCEKQQPKLQSPTSPQTEETHVKYTQSQIELIMETMHEYRENVRREHEPYSFDHDDGDIDNIFEKVDFDKYNNMRETYPIQHIDSESITSFDSDNGNFWEIFSIWRILLILFICLLIPPLFFFIAFGEKIGLKNYSLMRMIMNSEHRLGLYKGFLWKVDVNWFRYTCLIIGVLEILSITAGICVGFGVGLTIG